jgi:hypothetical protein
MSSGDGKLQKSPDFSPGKTKENLPPDDFWPEKKGLTSPIVELSYAEKDKPAMPCSAPINESTKRVFKRHSTHRLVQIEPARTH